MPKAYSIAVNYPQKNSLLTYLCPEENLVRGELVEVPLGRRKEKGVVLEEVSFLEERKYKLKEISKKLDGELKVSGKELELYQWMAKYYRYSLGQLVFDCLPKALKRPRPLKAVAGLGESFPHILNLKQSNIFNKLNSFLEKGFSQHCLHGVTGSGKSVVYLKLMQELFSKGRSVQFLLPEINLTPQFIDFFQTYLNVPIYSYHSGISASQKYGLWKFLQEDESPKLVLGVRSSLFLPIKNLGMIIVDEEHDQSFKQEDRCCYHGRDVAIKKAQLSDIPVLLGSATPSVESYNRFTKNDYLHYYKLEERAGLGEPPQIAFLDERKKNQTEQQDDFCWPLLGESISAIRESFDKSEQVLVYVNRLGFAQYIQCRSCGHTYDCPNCTVSLKYHKKKNSLSCHHCEYEVPYPSSCPSCDCLTLVQKGYGTEKIQEILSHLFPDKNIERFDRDEVTNFKKLEDKLARFHKKEIDLFVGTQMISKGHNFKNVNLVLILGTDSQLNYADFRSQEKVYQQITQVAGRAGRFGPNSKVLVQTLNPETGLFEHIKQHHFSEFYDDELRAREACFCSPYSRMVMVYLSSRFLDRLIQVCEEMGEALKNISHMHFSNVRVLGPRPANIEKRVNQFTWCFLLKSEDINQIHNLLDNVENNFKLPSGVKMKVDVDPLNLH